MKPERYQFAHNLVNSLPDAAICIDEEFNIIAFNPCVAKLHGSACTDFELKPLNELITLSKQGFGQQFTEASGSLQSKLLSRQRTHIDIEVNYSRVRLTGLENCYLLQIKPRVNDFLPGELFESIYNQLDFGVFLSYFDVNGEGRHGQFATVNDTACSVLGYERYELLKMNARSLNPPGNTETINAVARHLKREGSHSFNAIHVGKDGKHNAVHVNAKIITIGQQTYVLSQCSYEDNILSTRNIDESRFGRLLELSWDEIYVFDISTLHFSQANTGALNNLGYTREDISKIKITDLLEDISENTFRRLTESLFDGKKAQVILESVFKRKNGSSYPVEIRLQLSHSEVPPVFLANIQDISERKEAEQNLLYLANHDTLTGLFNRNTFIKKLEHEVNMALRSETLMAVMFIDLDGFKFINDTMGHDTGDQLLVETAKRLLSSTRSTDIVARQGGDEFTIILTNIKHTDAISLVAEKIIESISSPYTINDKTINTSCSIGITVHPFTESDNPYLLIKQADTAMYQAKNRGKNNFSYYAASLAKDELNQRELENSLARAFDKDEFEIYYQPKVNLRSKKLIGGEALIRWHNKKYPDISPVDFIPILEKSGLINRLDFWVLQQTCLHLRDWAEAEPNIVISVNLSAGQFGNKTLVEDIKNVIDITGVNAANLEIEITEGVLIEKSEQAETILNQLKEIGISISLDDFGSGYSSLSYLKQLPINRLKIDRAFVIDLENNWDSRSIIDAIINLADNLDLAVIAEGIETREQADILMSLNCFEGQGYLYGKPCPVEDFNQIVLQSKD